MGTFPSHRFYWCCELQQCSIEAVAGTQVTGTQAVGEGVADKQVTSRQAVGEGIADSPDCRRDGEEDIGFVGVEDIVELDTADLLRWGILLILLRLVKMWLHKEFLNNNFIT